MDKDVHFPKTTYPQISPLLKWIIYPGYCRFLPKNCCYNHKYCPVLISRTRINNVLILNTVLFIFNLLHLYLYTISSHPFKSSNIACIVNTAESVYCGGHLLGNREIFAIQWVMQILTYLLVLTTLDTTLALELTERNTGILCQSYSNPESLLI